MDDSYGSWDSPITAEWVTASQKRFSLVAVAEDDIYWQELRPAEGGRSTVMRRFKDGSIREMIEAPFSVRSRVHEYGGGSYTVFAGKLYFVNDKDQRIYVDAKPLTESGPRFADLQGSGGFLVAVGEKGSENFLAAVEIATGKWAKIAEGRDFYASPVFDPTGKKLAFLTWDHPNMPWDGTDLWVADFIGGKLEDIRHVAGGKNESIFQPQWSPQGVLHYVSDRTGWWNLYSAPATALLPMEAEFGLPQWVFGQSTYAFAQGKILASYKKGGETFLAFPIDKPLALPWTEFSDVRAGKDFAVFIAASATKPRAVIRYDLKTGQTEILAHNMKPQIDSAYFSIPQFITFPSAGGRKAYAYFYPPANPKGKALKGELPPLIVKSHGGPTASAASGFDLKTQYWTSRGFAVVDVDYGGSSGYGRAYRELLKGAWGVVDVEDCEAAAKYLIDKKLVDPQRIAITGGSAGGYTTLCALTFGKVFTVGASYYGVSSLEALADETHKFESRYLDRLVGPYPEKKELYKARSPLDSVDKLSCPIIFFQGSEDKVVPPDQAEMMYTALKEKGIPTKLIIYEGEQHGFRKAENIRDSLEKEREFYLQAWQR